MSVQCTDTARCLLCAARYYSLYSVQVPKDGACERTFRNLVPPDSPRPNAKIRLPSSPTLPLPAGSFFHIETPTSITRIARRDHGQPFSSVSFVFFNNPSSISLPPFARQTNDVDKFDLELGSDEI
jgi:hypothetical protein